MIQINHNINLHYIPMSMLKTTSLGIYIYRPLSKDEASANALLPYVLGRGCQLCPSIEKIAVYLEDHYGSSFDVNVFKHGDLQVLALRGKSISDKYAPYGEHLTKSITELIMSLLFEPVSTDCSFNAEFVRQEKKNSKDAILALINDKRSYAQRRCIEEMCGDDKYAVSKNGTIEGIDALNEKRLYEYYRKMLRTSVIDIVVCGDADIDEITDTIHSFADKLDFEKALIPPTTIFRSERSEPLIKDERMDVTQGKLSIGLVTGITNKDEEYWPLMMANSIFGGGAHSKLFNNVREKLSLAYYASSYIEKTKGLILVNAGIEFENYQSALDEIFAQLHQLQNGQISETELEAARLSIINSLDAYYDDQMSMQLFYISQRSSGVDFDIEYMKKRIRAVTAAEAAEAARSIKPDTIYFLRGADK